VGKRLPKGWKYRELAQLVRIESGGTPARSNDAYWGGETPWITAKDLKSFELLDAQERLTEAGAKQAAVIPEGTVLVLVRGMGLFKDVPVGVTARAMAFNQDIKALHTSEGMTARFIGYALQAQRHYLMGNVDKAGHGTGRLPTNVLEELPLPIPPPDERLRIETILQLMDSLVIQTEAMVSAREKAYQACLLEVMRPVNMKRSAGWHRVHLGEIFRERDEFSAGMPLLAISGEHGIVPRDSLNRRDTSAEDKSGYKVVRKGDIGYNTMRMWQGVFGLSRYDGIVSPAYTVITPDRSRILAEFATHLFNHPRVIHTFHRYSQGLVDDTLMLKYPNFSEIRLPIPDIPTQRRIAQLLDAQLREVKLLRRVATLRRLQKGGLMQKLLTGKWRMTRDLPVMESALV
jgi:type I restriction enzyme, S subunit